MQSKKQLNLLSAIAEAIPEERGGSIGSSGYDFQKTWGVAKIIELAEKEEEFLLVLIFDEICFANIKQAIAVYVLSSFV